MTPARMGVSSILVGSSGIVFTLGGMNVHARCVLPGSYAPFLLVESLKEFDPTLWEILAGDAAALCAHPLGDETKGARYVPRSRTFNIHGG
jgi:hypothetical protein